MMMMKKTKKKKMMMMMVMMMMMKKKKKNRSLQKMARTFPPSPYLRFLPPSPQSYSRPWPCSRTKGRRWDSFRESHSSLSENRSKGSRFMRRLPENNTGSCTVMVCL